MNRVENVSVSDRFDVDGDLRIRIHDGGLTYLTRSQVEDLIEHLSEALKDDNGRHKKVLSERDGPA